MGRETGELKKSQFNPVHSSERAPRSRSHPQLPAFDSDSPKVIFSIRNLVENEDISPYKTPIYQLFSDVAADNSKLPFTQLSCLLSHPQEDIMDHDEIKLHGEAYARAVATFEEIAPEPPGGLSREVFWIS